MNAAATLAVLTLPVLAAILYRRARHLRRALAVEANRRHWARIELQNARRDWHRARLRYRAARRAAVVDMYRARRAARRRARWTVYVGGLEVVDYLLTRDDSLRIAAAWRADGYLDARACRVRRSTRSTLLEVLRARRAR